MKIFFQIIVSKKTVGSADIFITGSSSDRCDKNVTYSFDGEPNGQNAEMVLTNFSYVPP